ncbi:response regulator [Winogradskyella arenosi]|uniref:histidine kinase n=1 Tax=Winogradskyella arenosi TaxID=533325 RepID=A0A368ZI71_9FLAO|nr:response regulator [Winogradskyella arenosi]RCW93444.1 signal transduction histidine kinase [Winogradskyella arenosi]
MFSIITKKEYSIPILSFLALNLIILSIWSIAINTQKLALKEQVETLGELLTNKFYSIVNSDIERLENLKDRLQTTDGYYFKYWEHDAETILEQNKSFKFIEWIDSLMIIKKVNPLKGNEAVVGLDISKLEYRKDEWIKHRLDSTTNITQWAKLTQGGNSFLVDVPVYFNNRFQGTITAGMDFKTNLDAYISNLKDFAIEIRDNKGAVFYTYNEILKNNSNLDFHYFNNFTIDHRDNEQWSMTITPVSPNFLMDKSASLLNMLYFGLVLSALMSLLIFFYLKAKKEALRTRISYKKLKRANKKLNKERNKAEKASKAKTEFLSNMSHEIRTPLNAILGFIQLLQDSDNEASNKTFLDLMDKSSKNLLALVDDVLDIDKIESRETSLNLVTFKPSTEIKAIVSQYTSIYNEKDLYLKLNIIQSHDATVIGDEGKYNQILINLIKNALKFTVAGGVTVSYEEHIQNENLQVQLTINDSGIGIPKDNLTRIFERFTQIDYGLKKKHSGSGLGLFISKSLVELMGGKISVESKLQVGSRFTVDIPFTISKELKAEDLEAQLATINLKALNVLIVDDNKINILVLTKILEQLGITPDTAEDGKQALEAVTNNNYQLVLMDIHMPNMNGYEATKIIRKTNKDIVIFGLSANVTKEAIKRSADVGMNDYLTKPLYKDKLKKLLIDYFS